MLDPGFILGRAGRGVPDLPESLDELFPFRAGDEPPPNYALDVEITGILRTAEAAGFDRFHLVGYSAGGAAR